MTGLKKRFNGQTCGTIGYNILGLLLDFIWGWPASATLNMICMFSSQPSELQTPAHAHFPKPLAVRVRELWASAALPAKGTDPAPRSAGCWWKMHNRVCQARIVCTQWTRCQMPEPSQMGDAPRTGTRVWSAAAAEEGNQGWHTRKISNACRQSRDDFMGFSELQLAIYPIPPPPPNPGLRFWFMFWFFWLSGSAYLLQERTENLQMLMFLPVWPGWTSPRLKQDAPRGSHKPQQRKSRSPSLMQGPSD